MLCVVVVRSLSLRVIVHHEKNLGCSRYPVRTSGMPALIGAAVSTLVGFSGAHLFC